MKIFDSYQSMIAQLEACGYQKTVTSKGYRYDLKPGVGKGTFECWGDNITYAFNDLNVCYDRTHTVLTYSDTLSVQMTFVEENNIQYYQEDNTVEQTNYGTFFYVNNINIPWYKTYFQGEQIRALTIVISNEFLMNHGISLSEEEWDELARTINLRPISIPSIATILRQVRYTNISGPLFRKYIETKLLEAFLILWDYSQKELRFNKMTTKTYVAVRQALSILTKSFIDPPIITDLAAAVNISKNTLQKSFNEVVGMSIHKYVRTLRLQKSLELLTEDSMTIENVAKAVGYNSKIHFYKAFKHVFAMKPTEMRGLLHGG